MTSQTEGDRERESDTVVSMWQRSMLPLPGSSRTLATLLVHLPLSSLPFMSRFSTPGSTTWAYVAAAAAQQQSSSSSAACAMADGADGAGAGAGAAAATWQTIVASKKCCKCLKCVAICSCCCNCNADAEGDADEDGDGDRDEFDFDLGQLQRKHFGKNFCAMWQAAPRTHTALQDTKCSFVENKQATTTTATTKEKQWKTKQVNRTNSQRTRFMHFHFVKHF